MPCTLTHLCPKRMARPTACRSRGHGCRRLRLDTEGIRHLPLFENLDLPVICDLIGPAPVEVYPRATMLFEAGSPAEAFFIVLSGRVKLFALTEDGRESIVEIIEPVSSFAEAAIFAGGVYPVGAEVVEEAALVRVGARRFLHRLRDNPAVACRILGSLLRWQRRLAAELDGLRHRTPMERVAHLLVSLSPGVQGGAVVILPMKKTVIASRLGMKPESLSRVLARLRGVGVRTEGRVVHIEDVARLHALCVPALSAAGTLQNA